MSKYFTINELKQKLTGNTKTCIVHPTKMQRFSLDSHISAVPGETIPMDEVITICEAESPWEAFRFWLEEHFSYEIAAQRASIMKEIKSILHYDYTEQEAQDELYDYISKRINFILPEDSFLNECYPCNVFVDKEDSNFEWTLNTILPNCMADEDAVLTEKCGLGLLIKSQGYRLRDANAFLFGKKKSDGEFLPSIYNELANTTHSQTALVFLASIPLKDLLNINTVLHIRSMEYRKAGKDIPNRHYGNITISSRTTCGLFDFINCGGGPLGIKLNKDIKLNLKDVFSVLPDGGTGESIMQCYGENESLYHEHLSSLSINKSALI